MDDIYEAFRILGISFTTDMSIVSKAFRALAKRYHPDSNPTLSSENQIKMQRINEAYTLIKKYVKSGVFTESLKATQDFQQRKTTNKSNESMQDWVYYRSKLEKAWRDAERKRAERIEIEKEKRRREEEVLKRFWEKVANMKSLEDEDEKKFSVVLHYVLVLIKFYYGKNLHNVLIRTRPYNIAIFEGYVKKFREIIKRIEFEGRSLKSEKFAVKTKNVLRFMSIFLNTIMFPAPQSIERIAYAYESYSRVVESTDKIMMDFFTSENPVFAPSDSENYNSKARKEIEKVYKNKIKYTLDIVESFLKNYPSSPLIDYAKDRVEMLESFYYAFL